MFIFNFTINLFVKIRSFVAIKTGFNLCNLFILVSAEACLQYEAVYDLSMWLRIGSNPAVPQVSLEASSGRSR